MVIASSNRVLFIAKQADYNYSGGDPMRVTGLKLSAGMCAKVLNQAGIPAKFVIVVDNNDIDREVVAFKPTHVIIEALWVVPSKFAVLQQIHPTVKWIVRIHSEIPFLSMDGVSIEWILEYVMYKNVFVSGNSPNLNAAIKDILVSAYNKTAVDAKNVYLPNCYSVDDIPPRDPAPDTRLHVGCFGAIRPFKNQLMQAIAAMTYAESLALPLTFHMNGTRHENGGSAVFKNLNALFVNSKQHQLELHPWMSHQDFLKLCATMHLGMQVSLSESFNIVTADMVTVDVPVVVSPAIYWMPQGFMADPTNLASIVNKLAYTHNSEHWWFFKDSAQRALSKQASIAADTWIDYFR